MSYCKKDGKDVSIFVTKEDVDKPEMVSSLAEDDMYGVVLPNGELNWDCPCLGGMAHGTCGQEFKDAFSCFHYSEEEEKGSNCIPQFKAMQECFLQHPEEYSRFNDDDQEEETIKETEESQPPLVTESETESNSQLKETL